MALRSFTVLPVLLSVVLAQQNPLIPPGISIGCTNFLMSLDGDSSLLSCTNSFLTALNQAGPSATSSSISSTLNTLCESSASTACSSSTLSPHLTSFYTACSNELTSSPNSVVQATYDAFYMLFPLKGALCAKDDAGNYCATELANSSTSSTITQQSLYTTLGSINGTSVVVPNANVYQQNNIPFLLLQSSMSSSKFCTACTRNILTPYIDFESSVPYAIGLLHSPLLSGQVPLYNNVTSTCGQNFLSGAISAAGGLSGGLMSGAVPRASVQELSAAISAIFGITSLVATSL